MAITIKKPAEIEKMRKAGKIVGDTLKMVEAYIKPGVTTAKLNELIEAFIRSRNAIPSFKNYQGFPAASCISVDEVVVHGIPSLKELREGEIVSIDVGAIADGYHGDAARTFAVGVISPQKQRLIDTARESFFEGAKMARAGKRLGDLSRAIQAYVEARGFGVVRSMVGHGIGKQMHEDPQIPNFGAAGTGPELKAGYTFAVEPMITLGGFKVVIDHNDGWTCRTADLSPSAHYENTLLITSDEPEILTL